MCPFYVGVSCPLDNNLGIFSDRIHCRKTAKPPRITPGSRKSIRENFLMSDIYYFRRSGLLAKKL